MKTIHIIIGLLATELFVACGDNNNHSHFQHQKESHTDEDDTVMLSEKQLRSAGVEIGRLTYRTLRGTIQATGQLELPPQNEAKLSVFIGGNVKEIKVIEGDRVRKGEIIASIEHPDLIEIQQVYQQLVHRIGYLKLEYERKEKLFQEEVTSGRDYQKAKADYFSARAELSALKSKLRLLNLSAQEIAGGKIYETIPILSPMDGYVKLVNVVTGQYAPPQQELFEIIDIDHIHADLMVFEKDIHRLKEGQEVIFSVSNVPSRKLRAKIYAVSKAFEQEPKALHVHAEIENKEEDLIPGMYIQGEIITHTDSMPSLPVHGLAREDKKAYIFIYEGKALDKKSIDHSAAEDHSNEKGAEGAQKNIFHRVEVIEGIEDGGFVAIRSPGELPLDTRVVIKGAYYLLAEMEKKGAGGHHH